MSKKKKSNRDKVKYPEFNPNYSTKIRKEYKEIDYVNELSDEKNIKMPDGTMGSEKDWLHLFETEFNSASLDSRDLDNNLHNTKELKKACYDQNNARNRCMYGIAKASNLVHDSKNEVDDKLFNPSLVEDAFISSIDGEEDDDYIYDFDFIDKD